jgi:Ice-binding-like
MNRIKSITNPLMWFMALLLAAFVAGCGGGNGDQVSSAKAITAYSLSGTTGTINEAAKTISVSKPSGTDVTALVATFTTTGSSVKVGTTVQVTGTTPNNFTLSRVYTVTAADGTTVTYTVTVTIAAAGATAAVDLLTAGDFAILASTAITYNATVSSVGVTGNVGISPSATITGLAEKMDPSNDFATSSYVFAAPSMANSGRIYSAGYSASSSTPATMTLAHNDMVTAYKDGLNRPAGKGTFLNAGASGNIGGLTTLVPGVYTWTTYQNVTIATDVTLNGKATDVWIFQIPGTFDLASATTVHLTGGALAKNIFWVVGGAVTLNTTSHMEGVILSGTAITQNAGATANSRLLAQSQVTFDEVTQPAP